MMNDYLKETMIDLANTLETKFIGETEIYKHHYGYGQHLEVQYYETEKFSYQYLDKTFGYGIKDEDKVYDAYGSTTININGIQYAYLNTYGQEDNWEDLGLKFDIILVSNKDINILTKNILDEIEFYHLDIDNNKFDIRKLGGKRAYYFNNETKQLLLRYDGEDYYKYFKDNQTPGSEKDLSGEKLQFILNKLDNKNLEIKDLK